MKQAIALLKGGVLSVITILFGLLLLCRRDYSESAPSS